MTLVCSIGYVLWLSTSILLLLLLHDFTRFLIGTSGGILNRHKPTAIGSKFAPLSSRNVRNRSNISNVKRNVSQILWGKNESKSGVWDMAHIEMGRVVKGEGKGNSNCWNGTLAYNVMDHNWLLWFACFGQVKAINTNQHQHHWHLLYYYGWWSK